MSLCIVSAFLDIHRSEWTTFQRSIDQYFTHFIPYLSINHEMIVFIDDTHSERLQAICQNSKYIKCIPINRTWLQEHIYAYQQLPRETEIMRSDQFKALMKHRLGYPECSKPEYNIMQHAKIDFVCYVIEQKLSTAQYYAWSDFGYFQDKSRIPQRPLNIDKFNLSKINFQGIHPLNPQDFNILFTLLNAPERVGGFFYMGHPKQLIKYQALYHQVCKDFHAAGIVDDDQHIMIQCIKRNPDLFKVWCLGGWHLTYNYFQQ